MFKLIEYEKKIVYVRIWNMILWHDPFPTLTKVIIVTFHLFFVKFLLLASWPNLINIVSYFAPKLTQTNNKKIFTKSYPISQKDVCLPENGRNVDIAQERIQKIVCN